MSKRDKKRKRRDGSGESGSSGGGLLTGMRGGFRNLAGTGRQRESKTPAKKALDILFWVLIIAALAFAFSRRFG